MARQFSVPRVKKIVIDPAKIKKESIQINIKNKKISEKNVGEWWDYLLSCSNDTKIDRNMIYWKYKDVIDRYIDKSDVNSIFNSQFSSLNQQSKDVLVRIYKKEFKK